VVAGSLIGRKVGIHPKRQDDWLVVPNLWVLWWVWASPGKTDTLEWGR
jgi:hypothetical protein